jgi:hypothetical protein
LESDYLKHAPCAKKRKVICAVTQDNRERGNKLSKNSSAHTPPYKAGEGIFSAISVGAVFILIGLVYVATLPASLWEKVIAFFGSFKVLQVPGIGIYLPAPAVPAAHTMLYNAVFQFCLGLGILQVILLALRFAWHSPIGKTAETVGHLVFWFGASYLIITLLNDATTLETWFIFWAAIPVVLGVSLIARALVLFARR